MKVGSTSINKFRRELRWAALTRLRCHLAFPYESGVHFNIQSEKRAALGYTMHQWHKKECGDHSNQ